MDPPITPRCRLLCGSPVLEHGFEGFQIWSCERLRRASEIPLPKLGKSPVLFLFWGGQGRVKTSHICPSTRKWKIDQSLETGLCSSWIYPWSFFWRCENNGDHVVFTRLLQPSKPKHPLKTPQLHGCGWDFFPEFFFVVAWNRCFLEDHVIGVKMRKCFGRLHFFSAASDALMSCEFQFCQLVIVDGMKSTIASIHFPVVNDLQGHFVMFWYLEQL